MKPDNIKRRSKKRRPDNYYGKWEQGQIVKSEELKMNIKRIRKWIDRHIHPQYAHLKTVLLLWIMMEWYGFSLRRMIGELHHRSGSRKAVGLKHVPSKSWLHKWRNGLPMDMLDDIILFTAGKAAYGTFSVDSSHHWFNRYTLIDDSNIEKRANAKGQKTSKGQRWVANICKHHHLQTTRYWLQ